MTLKLASICTLAALVVVGPFLTGCSEPVESTIPTYQVSNSNFTINIDAFGEIEAGDAQRITSPGRRSMVLAWLAPENSQVKKGDVIARFDAERIVRQQSEEEFAMRKIEQDILASVATQQQEQSEVSIEQTFVDSEFAFVDKFAIDDLRLYSKLEIIDTLANRDFLEAKDTFLEWKEDSVGEQHQSAISVLDIQKQGYEKKIAQFQAALNQLEVKAPNDGLLVYVKDRRGEKPNVGNTMFPGRAIAQIPNLDKLQAKLYVLADEAIDLATGQTVSMRLTAFADREFTGEITSVASFPREITRGDPTKYIELTASINNIDLSVIQPGRKLNANIRVLEQATALKVPLQSIIYEDEQSKVLIKSGSQYRKQVVATGRRNLHFIEIINGLNEGDIIALIPNTVALSTETGA